MHCLVAVAFFFGHPVYLDLNSSYSLIPILLKLCRCCDNTFSSSLFKRIFNIKIHCYNTYPTKLPSETGMVIFILSKSSWVCVGPVQKTHCWFSHDMAHIHFV